MKHIYKIHGSQMEAMGLLCKCRLTFLASLNLAIRAIVTPQQLFDLLIHLNGDEYLHYLLVQCRVLRNRAARNREGFLLASQEAD